MLCRPKLSPLRRRIRKYTAVFLAISVLFITYTQLAVKSQFRDIIIRNMHTIAEQATVQAVGRLRLGSPHRPCVHKPRQDRRHPADAG